MTTTKTSTTLRMTQPLWLWRRQFHQQSRKGGGGGLFAGGTTTRNPQRPQAGWNTQWLSSSSSSSSRSSPPSTSSMVSQYRQQQADGRTAAQAKLQSISIETASTQDSVQQVARQQWFRGWSQSAVALVVFLTSVNVYKSSTHQTSLMRQHETALQTFFNAINSSNPLSCRNPQNQMTRTTRTMQCPCHPPPQAIRMDLWNEWRSDWRPRQTIPTKSGQPQHDCKLGFDRNCNTPPL